MNFDIMIYLAITLFAVLINAWVRSIFISLFVFFACVGLMMSQSSVINPYLIWGIIAIMIFALFQAVYSLFEGY